MAIVTGDIFRGLKFGNVNSIDYGIYITGEGVYNAPERVVEWVDVPNRNGAIAIDQGRWENIEVTYPAGTYAENQTDFAQAISDFRNAILSQIGYQRLTDSYNPNEYRMAMYVSGLEVSAVQQGQAGQFELVFNCKPQRWLRSGENEVSVTSGDILVNPTLYESSPLLMVEGYGTIGFNGYEVEIDNAVMGDLEPTITVVRYGADYRLQGFLKTQYNTGDTITLKNASFKWKAYGSNSLTISSFNSITDSDTSVARTTATRDTVLQQMALTSTIQDISFVAGTTSVVTDTVTLNALFSDNTTDTATCVIKVRYTAYEDADTPDYIGIYAYITNGTTLKAYGAGVNGGTITASSTISILGNPTYIDCDLGECYLINGGEAVDLNAYIDLGSDLPTLASGSNTITYDNTVTDLKIVSRWWEL